MAANIMRLWRNLETLPSGAPNPEFDPSRPLLEMQVLSQDGEPPQWEPYKDGTDNYVRYNSHAAADDRCKEIEAKHGIHCYPSVIPRDANERPAPETLPLQPPLIPPAELPHKFPPPETAAPAPTPPPTGDEQARVSDASNTTRLRTLRRLAKKKNRTGGKDDPPGSTKKERDVRLRYRDD
jgi:hypothetical protein